MSQYLSLRHKFRLKGKDKQERPHMNMSQRYAKTSIRKKKVTLRGLK